MSTPSILVAVDFSRDSEEAIRQAVRMARHLGHDLVLLHVSNVPELPSDYLQFDQIPQTHYEARLLAALKEDEAKLEAVRERLSGQGPAVSQIVVGGFPDTVIPEIAEKIQCSMLVVATHGHSKLKWFFLGSVAQQVIRRCERDVLLTRGQAVGDGGYKRVCVGTDFSAHSTAALERACQLVAKGGHIDVVHFWTVMPQFGMPELSFMSLYAEMQTAMAKAIEDQGAKLVAQYQSSQYSISFHSQCAAPIPGFVHWLEKHSYDAAVVGSHGRRGYRRLFLGRVTEAVARKAPCSVVVCRGVAPAEPAKSSEKTTVE